MFNDDKCPKKDKRRHHHRHSAGGNPENNAERHNVWWNMMKQFHDLANGEYGIDREETREHVPSFSAGATPQQPCWMDYLKGFTIPVVVESNNKKETTPEEQNSARQTPDQEQHQTPSTSPRPEKKEEAKPNAGENKPAQSPGLLDFIGILNGLAKPLGVEVVNLYQEPATSHVPAANPTAPPTPPTEFIIPVVVEKSTPSKLSSTEFTTTTNMHQTERSIVDESIPLQAEQTEHVKETLSADPDESDKEWDVIDEENSMENAEKRRLIAPISNPANVISSSSAMIADELMSLNSNSVSSDNHFELSKKLSSIPPIHTRTQTSPVAGGPNFKKLSDDLKEHIAAQQSDPSQEFLGAFDPRINNAVHSMVQMGFSNEGGWLTQLLYSVDGDISRAIDLMQPIRRK